ncbi:MAG: deoxynucleoside kinase, partial [Fidelibacterota bacterium]
TIFAKSLYEMGNMSDRDWENYWNLFSEMTSFLQKPALIVYLKASTDTLLTRLSKRGRDYEKKVSPEYLHRLNIAYNRWIEDAQGLFNILTVETDNFNIFNDRDRLEYIIGNIAAACR